MRAADPVAGWTPDVDSALAQLAAADPDLSAAVNSSDAVSVTAPDGTIEVRLGDLAVVHTPEATPRRRRATAYAVVLAAAAAIALIVGVVPRLLPSGNDTKDRLAVTPLHPSSSVRPTSAPQTTAASTQPHGQQSAPAVTKTHAGAVATTAPSAVTPVLPPPAPLAVTMSLSATTVQAGSSITVNYSWTDGSGQVLYVNHVGISAVKFVRLPPCTGIQPAPKPSSGHGSWTFSLPLGEPTLIEGLTPPFDHPERIKVGVQIGTGGRCGPVEEKIVTQWVTLYPAVTATPSTTP